MNLVRWLLVLPAAVVGGLLLSFPLHWFITMNFNSGSTIELAQDAKNTLERALITAVVPFGFVYFGARTAPSHRIWVAIVLTVLLAALLAGARIFYRDLAPLGMVLHVAGFAAAFALLRNQDRKAEDDRKLAALLASEPDEEDADSSPDDADRR